MLCTSCGLFSNLRFDTVPTASITVVSFLEQIFSMLLLAGGTEEGTYAEKVKKKQDGLKYDSAEANSARERNNKLIQIVFVYQIDTTKNVHTIG
jgi:hypothetical protein